MKDEAQFSPKQDAEAVSVSDMFNLTKRLKTALLRKL